MLRNTLAGIKADTNHATAAMQQRLADASKAIAKQRAKRRAAKRAAYVKNLLTFGK